MLIEARAGAAVLLGVSAAVVCIALGVGIGMGVADWTISREEGIQAASARAADARARAEVENCPGNLVVRPDLSRECRRDIFRSRSRATRAPRSCPDAGAGPRQTCLP